MKESSSIQQRSSENRCLNQLSEQGWALLVLQNFRFSSKQRKILYNYFIDFTDEQVHLLIQHELEA